MNTDISNQLSDVSSLENAPHIDDLSDAIVDGQFLLKVGDNIVIERMIKPTGESKWFNTVLYEIIDVNLVSGDLRLFDRNVHCSALSNFINGPARGCRFKIAPPGFKFGKSNKKIAAVGFKKDIVVKQKSDKPPGKRRLYCTKGLIHTRIKSIAYGPNPTAVTAASQYSHATVEKLSSDEIRLTFENGEIEIWNVIQGY